VYDNANAFGLVYDAGDDVDDEEDDDDDEDINDEDADGCVEAGPEKRSCMWDLRSVRRGVNGISARQSMNS
jgi:hypothetical protein